MCFLCRFNQKGICRDLKNITKDKWGRQEMGALLSTKYSPENDEEAHNKNHFSAHSMRQAFYKVWPR